MKQNIDKYYNRKDDNDKLQRLSTRRIKFCCAINDYLLQKIIHSGDYVLRKFLTFISFYLFLLFFSILSFCL